MGQAGMVRGVQEVMVDVGALAQDMGGMVVMVDMGVLEVMVDMGGIDGLMNSNLGMFPTFLTNR